MAQDTPGIWRQISDPKLLTFIFLGFSSGLPLYVLLTLVQAWLSVRGLDVRALGLFSLAMFPYTWKFLWAPFMDRYVISSLGRRRGWMALTQASLFVAIGVLGYFDPGEHIVVIGIITGLVAFLSSSQDIVIDAYRREILTDEQQGLGSAIHVNAYRISSMVPGALSLILADSLSWVSVFWITAAFMLPGLVTTFVIDEPLIHGAPPKNMREAIVEPFREFVTRNGFKSALTVIAFVFFYKLGDSLATALSTRFYLDTGFTMTQIGVIAKTTGLWAGVAGGIVGGIWMISLGINRSLWVFGAAQAVVILGFSWLAKAGPDPLLLAAVIGTEAFAVSLGTAAFVAYIARTTDERYTATQFALFTSLASVPRTFVNASAGYIVDVTGWFMFFNLCFVLCAPGLLMLPFVAPWREKTDTSGNGPQKNQPQS